MISSVVRSQAASFQHHHQAPNVCRRRVNDIGLRRMPSRHAGDVADIDHGAVTVLIGKLPRSSICSGELLSWILYSKPPIFWVPTGVIRFCAASACDILAGEARDCSADDEIDLTLTLLAAERKGIGGTGTVNQRRAKLVDADVARFCSVRPSPDSATWDDRHRGGAVVQDQRGVATGGICLISVCEIAVTWRWRADIDVGLEEYLTMPKPYRNGDDVFDVVTFVVSERSNGVVIRPAI